MTEPDEGEQKQNTQQNMVYELYSNAIPGADGTLMEGVLLALKHRLYVPRTNFCMREELVELKNSSHTKQTSDENIVLAKDTITGKCVCCLYLRGWHMQAFTRKAYRRRGIAKEGIKRFGKLPDGVYALGGIEGAFEFWNKVGIPGSY